MSALPAAVLVSGNGSNLQDLIDASADGSIDCEIRAVVSNRPGAFALTRARRADIPAHVLEHGRFANRSAFDAALAALLVPYAPRLLILAGFMRILSAGFVSRYAGRMLNIHPSLLPAYPGLDTHARALADRATEHGASVHFVTAELDAGPVLVQGRVAVRPGDTAESLAERVHEVEHRIYPRAVGWIAEGRVECRDGRIWMDGAPLPAPVRL